MIRKLLIANRGEIAVRIARTCREMGVRTVGIFSDADAESLHRDSMDEAFHIGAPPPAESYLNQEKIIAVAKRSGAEAVHPGYGFLAENASFAKRVLDAGLIWVGPPPEAIAAMGSKTRARKMMSEAGVPVVPGSETALHSSREAQEFAAGIGYPVLLKASAGGGGKGMRIVEKKQELPKAFEAAQRESLSAFGDDSIYVEKYLEKPRHIEVQVFADSQGNVIHFGERECSIQRRHQKIIEESPSPSVTPGLRRQMGETAVAAARACGYVNAGTVECLMSRDGTYYFLEMNTRLQVEHPVTEEVTGLDLVRLQLIVASGEPLPLSQEDVRMRGHSIEVRIYAEDVDGGFLPSTGRLFRLRSPAGPGIREDSGLREGDEVSVFYDPMISKLIVKAESREAARCRMLRALEEYQIAGVRTTIPFCRHILASSAFTAGDFHTRSADNEFLSSFRSETEHPVENEELLAAAIVRSFENRAQTISVKHTGNDSVSGWLADGRRSAMQMRERSIEWKKRSI